MGIDPDVFSFTVSPLELILRGTLIYWLLFLVFRFILRRDTGNVGITDVLFVVLLGDAAQNAMIGEGMSVTDGIILIGTLVFWNAALDYLGFRFAIFRRLTEPPPLLLFKDGRKLRRNMRRQFITDDELDGKVREHGIPDLTGVEAVYLEASGEISVIRKPGSQ